MKVQEDCQKKTLYHEFSELNTFLEKAFDNVLPISYMNKKGKYFNVPCAFDIETTSTYIGDEKIACMYLWALGLNDLVLVGRTWEQFKIAISTCVEYLGLSPQRKLFIFVQNLSYEFQWFRKYFEWEKVFAVDSRTPIYATTTNGIEFRDSYILTAKSLEEIGKSLLTYKAEKQVGLLDYSLKRTPITPITDEEMKYQIYDVIVVMNLVKELMLTYKNIDSFPLTNTGVVRRFLREQTLYNGNSNHRIGKKESKYHDYIDHLLMCPEEYELCKRAFMGGFTHCNPFYTNKVVENVDSYDFTSSYPYSMFELFPMSTGQKVEVKSLKQFEYLCNTYACVFEVRFDKIVSRETFEHYISSSHCQMLKNQIVSNGRIVSADMLITTITNVDYAIIRNMYDFESMAIGTMYIYHWGYLPKEFLTGVLTLYNDKTTLKDVVGQESEYMRKKGMLNSCYGCIVTDIAKPEIVYNNGVWTNEPVDLEKAINKYNKSKSRFLYYPWGIFITAWSRYHLFTGILECKTDYIYSDTDSIKLINGDKHKAYFDKYNENVRKKLYRAFDYYNIPHELAEPKTIKGVPKLLGVWDYEGRYDKFKTLGAKRYMVYKDGKINITVSGLNKKACVPYLIQPRPYEHQPIDKIFDSFSDNLYVPPKYTGKMTHTYIDEPIEGVIVDYLGTPYKIHEESCIHLENQDYSLSLAREYVDFFVKVQNME